MTTNYLNSSPATFTITGIPGPIYQGQVSNIFTGSNGLNFDLSSKKYSDGTQVSSCDYMTAIGSYLSELNLNASKDWYALQTYMTAVYSQAYPIYLGIYQMVNNQLTFGSTLADASQSSNGNITNYQPLPSTYVIAESDGKMLSNGLLYYDCASVEPTSLCCLNASNNQRQCCSDLTGYCNQCSASCQNSPSRDTQMSSIGLKNLYQSWADAVLATAQQEFANALTLPAGPYGFTGLVNPTITTSVSDMLPSSSSSGISPILSPFVPIPVPTFGCCQSIDITDVTVINGNFDMSQLSNICSITQPQPTSPPPPPPTSPPPPPPPTSPVLTTTSIPVTLLTNNTGYTLNIGTGVGVSYGSGYVWVDCQTCSYGVLGPNGINTNLVLTSTGSLVNLLPNNIILWTTATDNNGVAPYSVVLRDDARLIIVDSNNNIIWTMGSDPITWVNGSYINGPANGLQTTGLQNTSVSLACYGYNITATIKAFPPISSAFLLLSNNSITVPSNAAGLSGANNPNPNPATTPSTSTIAGYATNSPAGIGIIAGIIIGGIIVILFLCWLFKLIPTTTTTTTTPISKPAIDGEGMGRAPGNQFGHHIRRHSYIKNKRKN